MLLLVVLILIATLLSSQRVRSLVASESLVAFGLSGIAVVALFQLERLS